MTLLGLSVNGPAIWLVPLVIAAVVLVGVAAVTVVLARVVRSVTFSLRELREVLEGRSSPQNPAVGNDPAVAADGNRVVGGAEGKGDEPGDARNS